MGQQRDSTSRLLALRSELHSVYKDPMGLSRGIEPLACLPFIRSSDGSQQRDTTSRLLALHSELHRTVT
jgi:hypothetical protein